MVLKGENEVTRGNVQPQGNCQSGGKQAWTGWCIQPSRAGWRPGYNTLSQWPPGSLFPSTSPLSLSCHSPFPATAEEGSPKPCQGSGLRYEDVPKDALGIFHEDLGRGLLSLPRGGLTVLLPSDGRTLGSLQRESQATQGHPANGLCPTPDVHCHLRNTSVCSLLPL